MDLGNLSLNEATHVQFNEEGKLTKVCRVCKEEKPLVHYTKCVMNRDGLNTRCKYCDKIQRVKHRNENKDLHRNYRLRQRFRITLEQYNLLLQKQNHVCGICNETKGEIKEVRSLAVDHNHITGKVRGLLCGNCNRGLGMFQDNPKFLERALKYLNDKI